jgi:hypothetical protein
MNFIKKINTDDKSLLTNIDFNLSYYYCCDKNELQKLILVKEDLKYIPCFPNENINYNDLEGKNILIFFKSPKIFYGILNIESVLLKSLKEKNYFESETDNEYENISTSEKVICDEKIYDDLLKKYSMVDIYGLFFIKFNHIYVFEYEIGIKNFNSYFTQNNDFIKLEYPKKIKEKNITKFNYKNFKNYLVEYMENLKYNKNLEINNKLNDKQPDILINFNDNQNDNDNNKKYLEESIEYQIPILWNQCDILKKQITDKKITKKSILFHWNNCENCEIVNNNNMEFKWNKKIVIKNIYNSKNHQIYSNIIDSYQNLNKFITTKSNSDFDFEENKINLIFCFEYKNIYHKCFFVIDK